MGKSYRYIDRVIAKWEKSRRNEIEGAKEPCVAKSDTGWLQAMDEWFEAGKRNSNVAEEADARRITQNEQSQMAIGMSDRKQSFREAEELKVVAIENSVPEAREMGWWKRRSQIRWTRSTMRYKGSTLLNVSNGRRTGKSNKINSSSWRFCQS
jgi:hypothetical protein